MTTAVVPFRQAASSTTHRHGVAPLRLIAAFKFAKAALLLVLALGAVRFLPADVARWAHTVLRPFASGVHSEMVEDILAAIARLTPGRMRALGAGAFAYSVLFAVEGTGLWKQRRWAEYLTVFATLSFIPFEVYEVVTRFSAAKMTALAVNFVVMGYVGALLRRRRAEFDG